MAKAIGKADILKRVLAEVLSDTGIRDDEFTAQDLMDQRPGVTRDSIRFQLDRSVEAGKLTKRKVVVNGSVANVYRFVDGRPTHGK